MRFLAVILMFHVFRENKMLDQTETSLELGRSCNEDGECNRYQPESGFQCSICVENGTGKGHCLNTFTDHSEWFLDQCKIPISCDFHCVEGSCENKQKKYVQTCFCKKGHTRKQCDSDENQVSYRSIRMLNWLRENAFVKPGESTRFYYRAAGDVELVNKELFIRFSNGLGFLCNAGKFWKTDSESSTCMDEAGVICTNNYVDMPFPYLLPNNEFGVTVFMLKDKLKGYLTVVTGHFKPFSLESIEYKYHVFVDYERAHTLKCIPVIQLKNCARYSTDASNYTFYRNEYLYITYKVKYLENGAYLSTAKENLQKCSTDDTTWTWTWAKYFREVDLDTIGDEKTQIGSLLKIQPFTLDFGVYRVIFRIKRVIEGATNENFKECFFNVKLRPVLAVIEGGEERTVFKHGGLYLSAAKSYDPNQPADKQDTLIVLWSCKCLTKHIKNCTNTCNRSKKTYRWMGVHEKLYFRPEELQYNARYRFRAKLETHNLYKQKGITPQHSFVTIKVANESIKSTHNYIIGCVQNCHQNNTLPNEILYLKVMNYTGAGLSAKLYSSKAFDWSYSIENSTIFDSVDKLKINGLPSSVLAIKSNSLAQGVMYNIMLSGKNSSEYLSKYSFTTVSINYEGNCSVNPQSGVKGITNFDIICDGLDGYIFEFYDKGKNHLEEKSDFNGRMLGTSEISGTLENVKITEGNIIVHIIQKHSGLYSSRELTVKLSPLNITEDIFNEIMDNLTSTVKLRDFSNVMNSMSFIPDILPDWLDRRDVLEKLLDSISKVKPHTFADVKLGASTMKRVQELLNTPEYLDLNLEPIWSTFNFIKIMSKILANSAALRGVSGWISSHSVMQVSRTLLDCLDAIIQNEMMSTNWISEDEMSFGTYIMLKEMAKVKQIILENVKNSVCYTQSSGLPPAKLDSTNKSIRIWTLSDDEQYGVAQMLIADESIPFALPKTFMEYYKKRKKIDETIIFQVALIEENIFSWSMSDVKSKLVSLSLAFRKKDGFAKKIKSLNSPIYVLIGMNSNLTNKSVKGTTRQVDPRMVKGECDVRVTVHRIYTPPKAFVMINFLFPSTTGPLRVSITDDFRPDCELMSQNSINLNSSNPVYPLEHQAVDFERNLYIGILPGTEVPANQTVAYEFHVSFTLCQFWIGSQWSTQGCRVMKTTTLEETVCACDHLSIFAAAFPVPPQSLDPISDAELFLTVLDNPLAVVCVLLMLIIYVILVLWGKHKDKEDEYKGQVILLEDNFPDDSCPYLVAVHTSARFKAGTTAHVGIILIGTKEISRSHILSSPFRKVLKRDSDDWFMIFTPKPLGLIHEIQIWHDNYGSSPAWFCDKIVVYDIANSTEGVFIVEQWIALQGGHYPEAILVLATDQDMFNIKRLFMNNTILGFRDTHTFLSIFARHPRSEGTRVQRVSCLMCFIMVAMLCDIMFYKPEDPTSPTDDFYYNVDMRDFYISVETSLISTALTMIAILLFKQSYKISYKIHNSSKVYRQHEYDQQVVSDLRPVRDQQENHFQSFYKSYVHYVSTYMKKAPLAPVNVGESERIVYKRPFVHALAWLTCIVVILFSSYLVMLYGLKLGLVQSQLWLTALLLSVMEDIFLFGPFKIILFAILLSLAFQVSRKVDVHEINLDDIIFARSKSEDRHVSELVEKRAMPMYLPLSISERVAMVNKKIQREKWSSLIEFVNILCFLVVVSALIHRLWISHYHGVLHLNNLFSKTFKKEYGAADMDKIMTISMVETFLEINFFESVFNLWWYNDEPMSPPGLNSEGIQQYWTESGLHKMIGLPELRQVRVIEQECSNVYFKQMKKCLLKWSLLNEDDNEYGEGWRPATYLDTAMKDSPWVFRNKTLDFWWTNYRFYGVYGTLYDVSGYFTFVGSSMKKAQKTFDELQASAWQDWYTRACFLTTTLYNVNDKVFSQVTILFEYFVDGSMSSSIKVIPISRDIKFGDWEVVFILFAFYLLLRSGYLINSSGLIEHLKSLSNVTRLFSVFFSFLSMAVWYIHHLTSMKYAKNYMENNQDSHFQFDQFGSKFVLLQITLLLLLCLTITQTFLLIQGGRSFQNIYNTLLISYPWLFSMIGVMFLYILALMCLQSSLYCQTYFRVKDLIVPFLYKKIVVLLKKADIEKCNLQVFILLKIYLMYLMRIILIIFFQRYLRIARDSKIRNKDKFDFVSFIIERIKYVLSLKIRKIKHSKVEI